MLIDVVEPKTVKLPVIVAFCVTVNEPLIVPPVNGRALFATVNAEFAYEPAVTALESAVLAAVKAELP